MSLFKPIKQKSIIWLHGTSRKLVKQIEKLKIYYNGGYKKIQPRILGRGVLSMVPRSIVESEEDNCKEHFIPCLGSLKKRQENSTDNKSANVEVKNFKKLETSDKEMLNCEIVPHDGKVVDYVYDVRFEKVTPYKKLARLRRQSTAPEFV